VARINDSAVAQMLRPYVMEVSAGFIVRAYEEQRPGS